MVNHHGPLQPSLFRSRIAAQQATVHCTVACCGSSACSVALLGRPELRAVAQGAFDSTWLGRVMVKGMSL